MDKTIAIIVMYGRVCKEMLRKGEKVKQYFWDCGQYNKLRGRYQFPIANKWLFPERGTLVR